jgi:hypothetical protein
MDVNQFDNLVDALNSLSKRGFEAELIFDKNGARFSLAENYISPSTVTIIEHHRIEGDSDADSTSIVYAFHTSDGTKGLIIEASGIYSNPLIDDFLLKAQIQENT